MPSSMHTGCAHRFSSAREPCHAQHNLRPVCPSRPLQHRHPHRASILATAGPRTSGQCSCLDSQQDSAAPSSSPNSPGSTPETEARVAVEGDTVTVHYKCMNAQGEIVETSDNSEPLTFEVGAGEVMGNPVFQAFDAGVRGLHIGDKTYLEASGGEWTNELLFMVPFEHEEVQRLQGRYKNVGGLQEGLVVELANNSKAMVLEAKDGFLHLDANNMMAGQTLMFELELVSIDPQQTRKQL